MILVGNLLASGEELKPMMKTTETINILMQDFCFDMPDRKWKIYTHNIFLKIKKPVKFKELGTYIPVHLCKCKWVHIHVL